MTKTSWNGRFVALTVDELAEETLIPDDLRKGPVTPGALAQMCGIAADVGSLYNYAFHSCTRLPTGPYVFLFRRLDAVTEAR